MAKWTLALAFLGHLVFGGTAMAQLKVGDDAPPFELVGTDGKTYKLADFKDKQAVVVAWFPKAMTRGCTAECKSMRDNEEQLKGFNVAYFTASCDKPEDNKQFAESLDLNFPILSDPTKKVAKAYGVVSPMRPLPRRWTFYIGPDLKILHIDKNVKTNEHGGDIAKKLGELGVAKSE